MTNRIRRWVSMTAEKRARQTSARVDAVRSGNRVVAAGMIRMAARDAARGEPRAAQRAVPLDRLARVVGATRIEAAVRAEQRTQRVLVGAQQAEQAVFSSRPCRGQRGQQARCLGADRRDARCADSRVAGAGSCRSRSSAGRRARTASRSMRRRRLRSTARAQDLACRSRSRRGRARRAAGAASSCRYSPSMRRPCAKQRCRTPPRRAAGARDASRAVPRFATAASDGEPGAALGAARRGTLRPPTVFMRARKPCVRLRLTTEGW